MSGSSFGTLFRITTWGESHGPCCGVVVDGCPAGLPLSESDIQAYLEKRRPGKTSSLSTRQEKDLVQILSGVFEGKTTGTPISLLIPNEDMQPKDYQEIATLYRPSHGDYPYEKKYGHRDYRGGGRASGRETVARVAAGAIASLLLSQLGISIYAFTKAIGDIELSSSSVPYDLISESPLYLPDKTLSQMALEKLKKCQEEKDSCGGIVECHVLGLKPGIGSPVFHKLDALLAQALLSIGGSKGVEFGAGFSAAKMSGSAYNDEYIRRDGRIQKKTNHSGGILAGISDGDSLSLRLAIKPTPSIGTPQNTVDFFGNPKILEIQGRHDSCIVPRVVPVVEAMVSLVLADQLLLHSSSQLDFLKNFWKAL